LKSIPTYVKFEYCNIAIKFHQIDLFLFLSYFISARDQHRDSNESRVFCEYNGSSTQAICISMRIFRKQKNSRKEKDYISIKTGNITGTEKGKSMVNVCLA